MLVEASPRRESGRPAKAAPVVELPKATKATKAPARAPAATPTPKVSKDELRVQVEKLEQLVVTLRTRSREANKAAKTAFARIPQLEAEVARLGKKAAAASAPAQQPRSTKPTRAKRQSREIDPGDAVPPVVAVQEPVSLDEEAETARENLEEHLSHR